MQDRDTNVLYFYRKLLQLYPLSYRQDYEEEMLATMQAMLLDAKTTTAKWQLLWRACKDYIVSLMQQNILAFEDVAPDAPQYIKRSSLWSTSLVLPFFIICAYNCLNQYVFRRTVPLNRLEAKTWVIYCIALPILAFVIVALAGTKSLSDYHTRATNWRSVTYNWFLLGIPLGLLVTIVLL
jgi:hypothetical protein